MRQFVKNGFKVLMRIILGFMIVEVSGYYLIEHYKVFQQVSAAHFTLIVPLFIRNTKGKAPEYYSGIIALQYYPLNYLYNFKNSSTVNPAFAI